MSGGQRRRVWLILLLTTTTVQAMGRETEAGRPLPHDPHGQVPRSFQVEWQEAKGRGGGGRGGGEGVAREDGLKGPSPLGSRPPSCEHKCRGCEPCAAVQVPTTADHFRTQFTNYEPEGWKCKCGSYLFNP